MILAWGLAFLARQVSDFSELACSVTMLSVLTNSSLEGGTEIFSQFYLGSFTFYQLSSTFFVLRTALFLLSLPYLRTYHIKYGLGF